MEENSTTKRDVLILAILAVAVIAYANPKFYSYSEKLWKRLRRKHLTQARLIDILDDLAENAIEILTELTNLVCGIRQTLQARGLENALSKSQLENLLMQQSFEHRLQLAHDEILRKHGVTADDLISAAEAYPDSTRVLRRIEELGYMLPDAMDGLFPLLPCQDLTEPLSDPEFVLSVLKEIHKVKLSALERNLKAFSPSLFDEIDPAESKDLSSTKILVKLNEEFNLAEKKIIASHSQYIRSYQYWLHCLAFHTRGNEAFVTKHNALISDYSQKTAQMIASQRGLTKTSDKIVEILDWEPKYLENSSKMKVYVEEQKEKYLICYRSNLEESDLSTYKTSITDWITQNDELAKNVASIYVTEETLQEFTNNFESDVEMRESNYFLLHHCKIINHTFDIEKCFSILKELPTLR